MKKEILRKTLLMLVEKLDSGMCELNDGETDEVIELLARYSDHGVFLTKYESCRLLGIERSRFDDLVRDGQIPRGTPKPGAKELFWRKSDITAYKNSPADETKASFTGAFFTTI